VSATCAATRSTRATETDRGVAYAQATIEPPSTNARLWTAKRQWEGCHPKERRVQGPHQSGHPAREGSEFPTAHDEMLVLQHNCANGKQVVEALQAGKMEAE